MVATLTTAAVCGVIGAGAGLVMGLRKEAHMRELIDLQEQVAATEDDSPEDDLGDPDATEEMIDWDIEADTEKIVFHVKEPKSSEEAEGFFAAPADW